MRLQPSESDNLNRVSSKGTVLLSPKIPEFDSLRRRFLAELQRKDCNTKRKFVQKGLVVFDNTLVQVLPSCAVTLLFLIPAEQSFQVYVYGDDSVFSKFFDLLANWLLTTVSVCF